MGKFKKIIQKNSGITLIEVILATVILGVVLTLTTTMIIQSFNIVEPSSQRMSAKQLTELNLREIARYVRNARKIDGDKIIDDDDEITIDEDVIISKEEDMIKLEDIDGNRINTFHSIKKLSIEADNEDAYIITLERFRDDDREDTVEKKFKVNLRNWFI